LQVNNTPLKAFVDSGAQVCIMSRKCAERCNIYHLVDKRFSTMMKGVGSQKSHGRIHTVTLPPLLIFFPYFIFLMLLTFALSDPLK